jgi:hypothetical protein
MKRWFLGSSVACLFFGTSVIALANVPAPAPPVQLNRLPREAKVVVVVDDNAKGPRLEIPENLLVAPDARRGDAGPRLPLIVVGLALTGSFVSAGLWLSRRGRGPVALLVAFGMFAVGSGTLVADIARPRPKPPVEVAMPAGVQLAAKITILVTGEKSDAIKLVVQSSMVLKTERPEPKRGE